MQVGKAPAQAPEHPAAQAPAGELPALQFEGGNEMAAPAKKASYAGSSRRVCISSGIFGMSLCA